MKPAVAYLKLHTIVTGREAKNFSCKWAGNRTSLHAIQLIYYVQHIGTRLTVNRA